MKKIKKYTILGIVVLAFLLPAIPIGYCTEPEKEFPSDAGGPYIGIAEVGTGGAAALTSKSLRQTVKTGVKGLADDLMTPPTGMVPAVAGVAPTPTFKNGSIKLEPLQITTDPRLRAPGMVQDVAQQPEFRGALDRRNQALTEVRENIARREAQGKTAAKYKKELAGKGSTV